MSNPTTITSQTTHQTMRQTATTALDLMGYIEGKEPVTGVYKLYSTFQGKGHEQVVLWNPAHSTESELNRVVFGQYTHFERIAPRYAVYALLNENGRLFARRGGQDVWTLIPWQRDRFAQGYGERDGRSYLTPVYRKTERTLRTHQQRVGGRMVKLVFGRDPNQYEDAPLDVVFLD